MKNLIIGTVNVFTESKIKTVNVLWDTGANCCCISEQLAFELQLEEINTLYHPYEGILKVVPEYRINVDLGNNFIINNLSVMPSGISAKDIDLLIGMNVLKYGIFKYIKEDNNKSFIFKIQDEIHINE